MGLRSFDSDEIGEGGVAKKGGWTEDEGDASPFAALGALRAALPEGTAPVPKTPSTPEPTAATPRRAVVRIEKKGRGGKEVTLIEQLGLPDDGLAAWASTMKKALGCGGSVEGDVIALSGDVRDRVVAWLTARGVRKISR